MRSTLILFHIVVSSVGTACCGLTPQLRTEEKDILRLEIAETATEARYEVVLKRGTTEYTLYRMTTENEDDVIHLGTYERNGVKIFDAFSIYNNVADAERFLFYDYVDRKAYISPAIYSYWRPIFESVDFQQREFLLQNCYSEKIMTDTLDTRRSKYVPDSEKYGTVRGKLRVWQFKKGRAVYDTRYSNIP